MSNITAEYIDAKVKEWEAKPLMESRFVRVYHLKDGSKVALTGGLYASREEAHKHLWFAHFGDQQGEEGIENIEYATIEERFFPTPYWKG